MKGSSNFNQFLFLSVLIGGISCTAIAWFLALNNLISYFGCFGGILGGIIGTKILNRKIK